MIHLSVGELCAVTLALSSLFIWLHQRLQWRSNLPLPPGPRPLPLLGNLLQMPTSKQEIVFYEWKKIYGDVIHVRALGKTFIILNSLKPAIDLLEKRGNNYRGRPPFRIFDMMGWTPSLTLMDYSKQAQLHRRMFHQYLNREECSKYHPIQVYQARWLVRKLAQSPENMTAADLTDTLEIFSTGGVVWLAYGHRIDSDDDWYFKIAHNAGKALFGAGPPGGTPVDIFPFLARFPSWFPGTYYANFARENRKAVRTLVEEPVAIIQEKMANGTADSSFVTAQLEKMKQEGDKTQITMDDVQGTAALMHAAGTDTTYVTLSVFILAMIHYPECQRKAQEELDAVIGHGRLPEFRDRASLPYIECLWQETQRWHQAAPLALPHVSAEDDVYNGWFIPKGSLVIANTRAITWDESVYHNPKEFIPERFLPKPDGKAEPLPLVFGWGRRICPGRHFGDNSLWIAIATMLATLTISKAVDEHGKEITPEVKFKSALLNIPEPFKCKFTPRGNTTFTLSADGGEL